MKKPILILTVIALIINGCVSQFIPEVDERNDYIVVDGLVTDQNSSYKVKISRSSRLDARNISSPVSGSLVYVTDNAGNQFQFKETRYGLYSSDSLKFRGIPGRKYTLHLFIDNKSYESGPMEMKPVPPIDSLYADILEVKGKASGEQIRGYQVYIDTFDPAKKTNFYRWDFTETWEFRLPYSYVAIVNSVCWKTAPSNKIYTKNTSSLIEDRVSKFPLNYVTTETDRLKVKYSLLVRQYALNEEEYKYWDDLERITENVGGLYDVVPMSVGSNILCIDDPAEKVLGFFSVSSVASKRIFINNTLSGFPDYYRTCPVDTVSVLTYIPNLNTLVFILGILDDFPPTFTDFFILTNKKECVDCTKSGSNVRPPYWDAKKGDTVIESIFK